MRSIAVTAAAALLLFTAGCASTQDPQDDGATSANAQPGAVAAAQRPPLDFSDIQPEDLSGPAVEKFGAEAVAAGVQEALEFYYTVGLDRDFMTRDALTEKRVRAAVTPYMTRPMVNRVAESADFYRKADALFQQQKYAEIWDLPRPSGFEDVQNVEEIGWFIDAMSAWTVLSEPDYFRPLEGSGGEVVIDFGWEDTQIHAEKHKKYGDVLVVRIKPRVTLLGKTDYALVEYDGPDGPELNPDVEKKKEDPSTIEYILRPTMEFVMVPGPVQNPEHQDGDQPWIITDDYGFKSSSVARKTNRGFPEQPVAMGNRTSSRVGEELQRGPRGRSGERVLR